MNLLVSDYDGTLYTNKMNIHANIEAVRRFVEKGNKFVIATAREYVSIKKEIEKYKIPCHYVICNIGGVIFDSEGKVLFSSVIEENDLQLIKDELKNNELVFYGLHGLQKEETNIIEVAVLDVEGHKKRHILQAKLPNYRIDYGVGVLYIRKDMDKSKGIRELITKEQLECSKIYTVGDSENDIEMLIDYEGYRIGNSSFLEPFNIEEVDSVKSLVYKIN